MNNLQVEKFRKKLSIGDSFTFKESFDFSKLCSILLSTTNNEKVGRELIIRVLNNLELFPESTKTIWNDLVINAGLYPYADTNNMSTTELVRLEFHRSGNLHDIFFHSEQMNLLFELLERKSLIISAPTSFGKSLLIEEVIANNQYDNIVVIQPTLALLDETRKKLKKYRDSYNIIVSTGQEPKERNIFLFTGERVCEYRLFPKIDFFVIDEFYKLSFNREESDRAVALNLALYKLLKSTNNFLLLGPHISSITSEFVKKYSAEWKYTDFATVAIDVFDYYHKGQTEDEKMEKLFNLLSSLDEPTLIYCSSPDKTNKLAKKFINHQSTLIDRRINNSALIEWIKSNIHRQWDLIDMLTKGVGIHHGGLPRHIASAIVDQFNAGEIKYLFCTSTLIEGVNTSAKNVIFFHKKKGQVSLDYFDYKNIIGRSGRMMKHLIGNVYKFEAQPNEKQESVDIPVVDQNDDSPVEMYVQMDEKDLKKMSKEKLNEFKQLPDKLQKIIKENVGIPVDGQIAIVKELMEKFWNIHSFIKWTKVPKNVQLEYIINLCWQNIKKDKRSEGGIRTPKQLAFVAISYYHLKSLKAVIDESLNSNYMNDVEPEIRIQSIINNILQISKHWFDYKLPKWLSVISSLQEYVCEYYGQQSGNYTYFIQSIENHFLSPELTVLLEYDIPATTIKKLENLLAGCENIEEILVILKKTNLKAFGLIQYEIDSIISLF